MKNNMKPASFLLRNSKGHPDFIMTMLVAVILATFLVILFWMWMNTRAMDTAIKISLQANVLAHLKDFNETSRLIILGLFSSVFSLAGAYYLRRMSQDKVQTAIEKVRLEQGSIDSDGESNSGLLSPEQSTLLDPNYDDGEEDI